MSDHSIERLNIRDAAAVTRCMLRTYGANYPSADVYEPDRIARLNASGDMISVVARAGDGEIVGHYALIIENRQARLGELGQAVVVPEHRRHGLMGRMRAHLEAIAREEGLVGLYSAPVTTHDFSQRVNYASGSREVCLILGYVPQSISFIEIPGGDRLPQRESVLVFFKYLEAREPSQIHVPKPHRDMADAIFRHIGSPRTMRDGDDAPLGEKTIIEMRVTPQWSCSWLGFFAFGKDFFQLFGAKVRELLGQGIETIHADLPLGDPLTPWYCLALEEMGFFFIGVIPDFLGGVDSLRLQYFNSSAIDFSRIQVFSPFAKELLDYVRGEYDRAEARKREFPFLKSLRQMCERSDLSCPPGV